MVLCLYIFYLSAQVTINFTHGNTIQIRNSKEP